MAALANPKHEMFARGLVQGWSQSKAYDKAGYQSKNGAANASTLAKRAEIKARVEELINERERATGNLTIPDATVGPDSANPQVSSIEDITPDGLMVEIMNTALAARAGGQFAAALKGFELLGRSMGLFSDEEVAKRKRGEAEAEVENQKNKTVPIEKLNRLLTEAGFKGTIDLTKLDKQPEPALPVKALKGAKKNDPDNGPAS